MDGQNFWSEKKKNFQHFLLEIISVTSEGFSCSMTGSFQDGSEDQMGSVFVVKCLTQAPQ